MFTFTFQIFSSKIYKWQLKITTYEKKFAIPEEERVLDLKMSLRITR